MTCMAAHCVITGERRSLWLYACRWAPCPFDMADDELFIAHSVTAEASCFVAMRWPLPTRIIDTMVEVARLWNGKKIRHPDDKDSIFEPSLLGSLAYFGIPCRGAGEKDATIDLVLRGGPYTPEEIERILAYCMDDAEDAARLAAALFLATDLVEPLRCRQAVWRGRCVAALSCGRSDGNAARHVLGQAPLDARAGDRRRAGGHARRCVPRCFPRGQESR